MLRFKMDKISILQFAILQNTPTSEDYNLKTTLTFKVDVNSRHVACITRFDFMESDKEFLICEVQCEFLINSEDWKKINIVNEKLDVPMETLELLAVQTIGASRGILYCKTEGTPVASKYILPPINVHNMMQGNSV